MLINLRLSPPLLYALRGTALLLGLAAFLCNPSRSSAQTTKVLEDAHVEISFPKGWSVAKADIKATEGPDDEVTIDEAFASAELGRCVDRVRQAYVAHPDGEDDISVVVMEVDIDRLGLKISRACAMAAANRRIKSVEGSQKTTSEKASTSSIRPGRTVRRRDTVPRTMLAAICTGTSDVDSVCYAVPRLCLPARLDAVL